MLLLASFALSFTTAPRVHVASSAPARHVAPIANSLGRRDAVFVSAAALSALSSCQPAQAADGVSKVVVAGATGQTGRRCLERLAKAKEEWRGFRAMLDLPPPKKPKPKDDGFHPHWSFRGGNWCKFGDF